MGSIAKVDKKDQLLMQLTHYFITVENYTPIVVKGVKNEIWLENLDAEYRIVRINANYIHNDEQLEFDLFKIKNIVKQIKKKTLSFKVKTLNIFLDLGANANIKDDDKIKCLALEGEKNLKKNKELNAMFPELKNNLVETDDGLEFVINVTNDINVKTEKENREFERVFKKKKPTVTVTLIVINVLIYIISTFGLLTESFDWLSAFALNRFNVVEVGQIYRLITSAFMHQEIIHLLMNMYALYIIGTQVESYIGKPKYLFIYLFSAISGSLLSCVTHTDASWSLGASGAIFGLMGTLIYFGYHYRLYLDSALKSQIIPLVILNLAMGFIIPGIDNAAHIGGLVGGLFITMALGVKNKTSVQDSINGAICSIIFIGFMSYLLFFAR